MPLALKLKQQQEQTDYIREIFEYLVIGTDRSILADKPAIILLFTFFSMQPTNPWGRVNIPVTKDEFVHLKSQVQKYCQEQVRLYCLQGCLATQIGLCTCLQLVAKST